MWRRMAAAVTVLLLAGCTAVPAASPSTPAAPASTRLTAQVLGALIEEHFGVAYAVTGTDAGQVAVQPTVWVAGIAATAYYRATPGEAELAITVGYSAAPLPSDFTCPPKTCTVQGNIYVRDPEVGASDVISLRDAGFVQVTVADGALPDASLPTAVALASDPRIAVLTDAALAASAATNPRWRTDDLGCGDSTATGLIPLPAADGDGAVEPPTAQGLAAVIASRVATGCVGGSGLEAIAYLGPTPSG